MQVETVILPSNIKEIKGPPKIFRTKREAVASFEAFIDVLLDAKARRI